ncbi:unnamed protein product, partial [Rotaria magnacalcarata]
AASPSAYVQTYGLSLLDGASLVARARSAGVVEDISAPGYVGYGLGAYGQEWAASSGLVGAAGLYAGGAGVVDAGIVDGGVALGGWNGGLYGGSLGYGYGAGLGYGYGAGLGYGAGYGLGYGGLLGQSAVVSRADAAFLNADSDYNGSLDRDEFRNLLAQNL